MSPTTYIHTLPAIASSPGDTASLKQQIAEGLLGNGEVTVPGERDVDAKWAFKRSVPTVVLYDEQGLRLYDRITADAKEYYLFEDELNLLKTHGGDIARSMGFGKPHRRVNTDHNTEEDERQDTEEEEREERERHPKQPVKRWREARWGDTEVGKWNQGVNGEEGLAGGVERGYDVVELGAGALRKTGHLLSGLASAVDADEYGYAPITYHPLDLSYPELDRVLGEMDEAFGDKLSGKVECIGLHGDYMAGLDLIRQGKLASLRSYLGPGRGSVSSSTPDNAGLSEDGHDSLSPVSAASLITPEISLKPLESSPPLSASLGSGVSPGPIDVGSLPSAITAISEPTSDGQSGTWSPISEGVDGIDHHAPKAHGTPPHNHSTSPPDQGRPLHFVFLGSSLGNFDRSSAPPFLKSLPLKQGDTLLLGLDGRPKDGEEGAKKVERAYNDPAGYTRAFEEHGWDVVRAELGLRDDPGVEFLGRYNDVLGRHEAYFRSKERQTIHLEEGKDVTLEKDELLNIEWSYKYSLGEALELFKEADLRVVDSWKAPESEYRLWLLERPSVRFRAQQYTPDTMTTELVENKDEGGHMGKTGMDVIQKAKAVPNWDEWGSLWSLWDHITLEMIPEKMLHQKPIDLRHICLFYLGHIPTFLDIYLTRMTGGKHSEPEYFKDIFERGIDPDVDDPTQIHAHSEVPTHEEDWPVLGEILAFRDRVRSRLQGIYDQITAGTLPMSRFVGRTLFLTFEHEAMHAETLLYMLAQSPLTRAPTAVSAPQWPSLAKRWKEEASRNPNKVLSIPEGTIEMGHDDLEADDALFKDHKGWESHELGWDNENPHTSTKVKAFKVDSLVITNNEYLEYLKSTRADMSQVDAMPASWQQVDGEWKVRTLYGPLGFDVAGDWPLMASKLELEAFAKAKGGRLPTEAELRMLWQSPEGPRVDGALANIGFKNWHPVPPMNTSQDTNGETIYGHNGGVWEWTDTVFEGLEGYVPSKIYPGYSADFFDGKHFVVIGGSFATVPSIAERKSFRNWYQANYRFSFIGGRVAYDA